MIMYSSSLALFWYKAIKNLSSYQGFTAVFVKMCNHGEPVSNDQNTLIVRSMHASDCFIKGY